MSNDVCRMFCMCIWLLAIAAWSRWQDMQTGWAPVSVGQALEHYWSSGNSLSRLQAHFSDCVLWLSSHQRASLASLVGWSSACSSNAAAIVLAFLTISSPSFGGNTTLSGGR